MGLIPTIYSNSHSKQCKFKMFDKNRNCFFNTDLLSVGFNWTPLSFDRNNQLSIRSQKNASVCLHFCRQLDFNLFSHICIGIGWLFYHGNVSTHHGLFWRCLEYVHRNWFRVSRKSILFHQNFIFPFILSLKIDSMYRLHPQTDVEKFMRNSSEV